MAYYDHNDKLVIDQYDLYEYEENSGMLPLEPEERFLDRPRKEKEER